MERRKFFKFLGLSTAAAAGGAVTAASLVASGRKTDAVKEIENLGYSSLIINQQYGQERSRVSFDGSFGIGTTAPKEKLDVVSVSMTPGPDGELYLKTNGKWRRIVTE
jgi:hypothetical protein